MSELSRRMRNKCNITSTAVAPQVKWRWIFKCASSGLGENAFQHRWKFTIGIIFYVPNTSLPQNSSSSGQWKTCKYYVKNAKKTPYLNDWYCGSQFVAQQLSCINILCPVPCTMSIPYLFRGVQAWEYYYSILIYPTQLWTRVSKGRHGPAEVAALSYKLHKWSWKIWILSLNFDWPITCWQTRK